MKVAYLAKAGAIAATALTFTACNQGADTSAQANETTASAEATAREMHNEMTENEAMAGGSMGHGDGMNGTHDMDGMENMAGGNMAGGKMSSMNNSSSSAPMPMEDDM